MEYSQKSTAEKELHHKKVDDYNEPALDLYIIDLTWRRRSLSLSHSTPRVHVQLLNKNFLALALPTDYTLEWTV